MASSAFPSGMVPSVQLSSGYNTQGFETLEILDGYTTSIFFGDVVKMASTGVIQKDTGTATLTPYGVFVGCRYVDPTLGYVLDSQSWPASTTTGLTVYAKVVTDPNAVFQIQSDEAVAQTALGANAAIVQTAGTAAIGRSRNALDGSTVDTTSTLPLRIVGFVDSPNSVVGDAFTDVLVKFNNHQLTTLTGI